MLCARAQHAAHAPAARWAVKDDGHHDPNARALLKPVLNLFYGERGSKRWKAAMDAALKAAPKGAGVRQLLADTLWAVPPEVLDGPPLPARVAAAIAAGGGNVRTLTAPLGGAAAAGGLWNVPAGVEAPAYALKGQLPKPEDRAAGEEEERRRRAKAQKRGAAASPSGGASVHGGGGGGQDQAAAAAAAVQQQQPGQQQQPQQLQQSHQQPGQQPQQPQQQPQEQQQADAVAV